MDSTGKNSVLVVDDEKSNLMVLVNILSPDYTVYMTKSGSAAIEMANKHLPDIILLDIIMPDMNGFEVLSVLKASASTQHIPVIIITGLDSVEDEEKGLDLQASDFIHKPFSTKVVRSRVRNQIQIVNQIRAIKQYASDMQFTLSKMEAIVNNYKGVIWSVDTEGVITSFNGQFLKINGISPESLIGKNIELARAQNRHVDIVDNVEKTFREGPQEWIREIDGIVFRSHTTPICDSDGNMIGIVGSTDDVTQLVKLHQDLKAAVEAAETANNAKSAFLARISHEIRTPLNAVLGISEIQLQNETLSPDVKEALAWIYNSGDLLLGIINDILDISKIEAGKLELAPARYDVASLINDTVFLNVIKYENKPIELILNVDENVSAELFGDELRIRQILNNLLSNAFKYTKAGEVEISLNTEYSADLLMLIIRVRDTGQGMTKEQVDRIFDEYSRFNLDANRTTEGTGLGMGITKTLIQMMNGEILVESEQGKGSLFTVRLPQGSTGAPALGKESVEKLRMFRQNFKAKTKKAAIVRKPMPFGKVLVVDDMEMNLYVAKWMLDPYGLKVDTALSGAEAIEKITNNAYNLVLMDHMMPVMDGMETTRRIRKLGPEYEKIPIIAITANAVSGAREMFLANGFDGYVSKPIAMRELDKVLKEWMLPEKSAEDEKHDSLWDEIGKIDEIDMELGLNHFSGNKYLYLNILDMLNKKIVPECSKMGVSLDTGNHKTFSVSAHALKSFLATIGALELSEKAMDLETGSKNQKIDYCAQQFPAFKEDLFSLHERLSVILSGMEVLLKKN